MRHRVEELLSSGPSSLTSACLKPMDNVHSLHGTAGSIPSVMTTTNVTQTCAHQIIRACMGVWHRSSLLGCVRRTKEMGKECSYPRGAPIIGPKACMVDTVSMSTRALWPYIRSQGAPLILALDNVIWPSAF